MTQVSSRAYFLHNVLSTPYVFCPRPFPPGWHPWSQGGDPVVGVVSVLWAELKCVIILFFLHHLRNPPKDTNPSLSLSTTVLYRSWDKGRLFHRVPDRTIPRNGKDRKVWKQTTFSPMLPSSAMAVAGGQIYAPLSSLILHPQLQPGGAVRNCSNFGGNWGLISWYSSKWFRAVIGVILSPERVGVFWRDVVQWWW